MRFLSNFLFIIILLQLLAASQAAAQILNSDKFGQLSDTSRRLTGDAGLSFGLDKKIEMIYRLNADADISYRFHKHAADNSAWKHAAILAGRFEILQTEQERLLNGGFVHNRYRLGYNKRVTPEVFTQYQWDNARGLEERFLVGAGPRLTIMHDSLGYVYFGTGLMFEHEQWNHSAVDEVFGIPDDVEVMKRFLKSTSYISFSRTIIKNVNVGAIFYFQTRPDSHFDKPRIAGDLRVQFKISDILSFAVAYNISYDRQPVVPIERHTYSIRNRLGFSF